MSSIPTESSKEFTSLISPFIERLSELSDSGATVIASSSFQTQSIPLLHILSIHAPSIPVYFLDTGFHFPETLAFRDEVADKLSLRVVTIESPVTKITQVMANGQLMFSEDAERCCFLNKTLPMEPILASADFWITGVRSDQSEVRADFASEVPGPHGVTRLHPMLAWTRRDIWRYVKVNDLPRHPLELLGFDSIGCSPCTRVPSFGEDGERGGRWQGQNKTECGLHTTLANEN